MAEPDIIHYSKKEIRSVIISAIYLQLFIHLFTIGVFLIFYTIFTDLQKVIGEIHILLFYSLPLFVGFIWIIIMEIFALRLLNSNIREIRRMKKHMEAN